MSDDDISRGVRQAELDLDIGIDRTHLPEDEWLPPEKGFGANVGGASSAYRGLLVGMGSTTNM